MQINDFKEENSYLNKVNSCIKEIEKKLEQEKQIFEEEISEQKAYFSENYYEINGSKDEIANINDKINEKENYLSQLQLLNIRLNRQKNSAYFGRIDFVENNENNIYYIGMGHIQNEGAPLVYDWRADMSSLFYDFSKGNAFYVAPIGKIEGEITKKRQYKIENGQLIYFIDNDFNVSDEILQEELAKDSSNKLKQIVATIQKEQNELIRSDDFSNWIVQGVAGSGKTSIALHRIAYLLYKHKDFLKSYDILILSPSNLFSEYISDILPLLGEDNTIQTTFDNIASKYLNYFENKESMLNRVLDKTNQDELNYIAIKSSFEFLNELLEFIKDKLPKLFVPKTIKIGKLTILEKDIANLFFDKFSKLSVFKRIDNISEYVLTFFHTSPEVGEGIKQRIKSVLYSMFVTRDIKEIYNIFLSYEKLNTINLINYEDIAPMLILKHELEGLENFYDTKYMIIDEMQDLSPCQIHLFELIWNCPKIYFGDINQCLEKQLNDSYLLNLQEYLKARLFILNKSYRCSLPIAKLTQKMIGIENIENLNQNGDNVEVINSNNTLSSLQSIINNLDENKKVAIICKNKGMLEKIKTNLHNIPDNVTITTIANSKGVDFYHVIVPFVDEKNYNSNLDKNLLYIASTRATMKLTYIFEGEISKFLKDLV
ncbi:MAG: UvrD-helicase domain-containing protein [Clostridia bacterium]|nr:UvrD-helicase domain-containing protein [Clostridia bacterium]